MHFESGLARLNDIEKKRLSAVHAPCAYHVTPYTFGRHVFKDQVHSELVARYVYACQQVGGWRAMAYGFLCEWVLDDIAKRPHITTMGQSFLEGVDAALLHMHYQRIMYKFIRAGITYVVIENHTVQRLEPFLDVPCANI